MRGVVVSGVGGDVVIIVVFVDIVVVCDGITAGVCCCVW